MIQKLFFLMAAFILSLASFLIAPVSAQNKVVVIPLMEEAPPLEPFAPLAAESPPASAYFDNPMGGHVTDKVTGLVWQKSDDDNKKNWNDAWDYCQDLKPPEIGAWSDWRLPSVDELMSIVDYGAHFPAINSVFWDTEPIHYWSADTVPETTSSARTVNFETGIVGPESKSANWYVRCVRRLSVRDNAFKINANGTVSDYTTGLMWQRENDNIIRPWDEANSYCQGLSLGGKQDWRMPNIKELWSITDSRIRKPAIDAEVFPNHAVFYWSATTDAVDSGNAWYVIFDNGVVDNKAAKSALMFVRCVRGGQ